MMKKRLDVLLVERGAFPSRQRARGAIMAGIVYVDGRRVDKAGTSVSHTASIEVRGDDSPYVSRGGLKLAAGLSAFAVDPKGWIGLDVGASTGGFTDCLLQAGASKIYAVDVGYGQLDWTLRNDPRVVVMERTNARYLTEEHVPEPVDIIVCDASFIGLGKLFPAFTPLLKEHGCVIALVKPQFEAGRARVGRRGVVRDAKVHEDVLLAVADEALANALRPVDVTPSPITGPQGNVEYLLFLRKDDARSDEARRPWADLVRRVVEEAEPLRIGRQESSQGARNIARDPGAPGDGERER